MPVACGVLLVHATSPPVPDLNAIPVSPFRPARAAVWALPGHGRRRDGGGRCSLAPRCLDPAAGAAMASDSQLVCGYLNIPLPTLAGDVVDELCVSGPALVSCPAACPMRRGMPCVPLSRLRPWDSLMYSRCRQLSSSGQTLCTLTCLHGKRNVPVSSVRPLCRGALHFSCSH